MKLKHYFVLLTIGVMALTGITFYATYGTHPKLFYVTEAFVVAITVYLWYFYRKTIRPFDTLIGGMELVRELDLTTRLAPSGQHETDTIVRTFNDLLNRLRSEHLRVEEQYTFLRRLLVSFCGARGGSCEHSRRGPGSSSPLLLATPRG